MRASSRKLIVLLLGIVVLGFVVYRSSGMIHLADFSGTKLLHAIRNARVSYLLLSIVTIYGCYALRPLRWREFQKHVGQAHFWDIYEMTLAGFPAALLHGRAGEPLRPLPLPHTANPPPPDTSSLLTSLPPL